MIESWKKKTTIICSWAAVNHLDNAAIVIHTQYRYLYATSYISSDTSDIITAQLKEVQLHCGWQESQPKASKSIWIVKERNEIIQHDKN